MLADQGCGKTSPMDPAGGWRDAGHPVQAEIVKVANDSVHCEITVDPGVAALVDGQFPYRRTDHDDFCDVGRSRRRGRRCIRSTREAKAPSATFFKAVSNTLLFKLFSYEPDDLTNLSRGCGEHPHHEAQCRTACRYLPPRQTYYRL
jgi:hypothetical protein